MKFLVISMLLLSLAQLGISFLNPALPIIGNELGVSDGKTGYLISAFLGIYGVSQLIFAPLSDRVGRRSIALIGILLLVVGLLLGILAQQFWSLMIARLLQGAGAGALSCMAKLVIRDNYPVETLTRQFAILEIAAAVTPSIAPWLGGEIVSLYSWRWVLLANLIYALLVGLVIFIALPKHQVKGTVNFSNLISSYAEVLKVPSYYYCLLPIIAIYSSVLLYNICSPFMFAEYGVTPEKFGRLMILPSFGAFAGSLSATWLGGRKNGNQKLIYIGLSLFLLAGLLALSESQQPNYKWGVSIMILSLSFVAFGYGASFSVLMSKIMSLKISPGPAIALASCCQLTGSALINWGLGRVVVKPQFLMSLFFIITALVLVICYNIGKKDKIKII